MASFILENLVITGFSPRQAQTLALTAQGLTTKEAAKLMAISPRTVEMNLNTAMLKIGARNRAHLIAKAFTEGMITTRHYSAAFLLFAFMFVSQVANDTNTDDLNRLPARPARVRISRGNGRTRDSFMMLGEVV